MITHSLSYGHFITQILKYFKVLINEPSCKPSKSIRDEIVYALGFECSNGSWVKFTKNKYIFLAPSADRPLNDMVPADQLPDFSLLFWGQRRHRDPPMSASTLDAFASELPPPEPLASDEITLQQLMDEVMTLSVQQSNFQQHILDEHQRLSQ